MKNCVIVLGALASALLMAGTSHADSLTSTSIVQLTKTGLGDEAIIAKIRSDGTFFDLSTDQMIELRNQGVSSAVIAAMLSNKPAAPVMSLDSPDPSVPHAPGVYLLTGTGDAAKMQRIEPTVSNQAKTGGILGYAFTGGLASASVKVLIQKEDAAVRGSTTPRFYFYFDQAANGASSNTWASGMNTFVSSPSEFTLIRLKKKSGAREVRVGSMNIAGAKTGVMDRDRIAFEQRLLQPGVYQVDIAQPLTAGEYGFIFSIAGGGTGGAMTARIFDFGVQ